MLLCKLAAFVFLIQKLGIEVGRWHGVRREDRVCKECGNGEVEDIDHFVMRCEYVAEERVRMERLRIDRVEGWNELGATEKVVMVMDRVCRDKVVARAVEKMWKKSFCHLCPSPTGLYFCCLNLCCSVIKRHVEYVFL